MNRTKIRKQLTKPQKKKRVYFLSDAHLGLGSEEEDHQREQRIIRFLDFIKKDAEQIFIVGDLFDYWFEYKSVVPKKYFRLLTKLSELTDKKIRVHFIAGNHDYWVKDYFITQLGMEIHLEPLEIQINGKKFLIHHGDGLLKDDTGYKILKKILRNKFNIFLYSLIHPDISSRIARWSSRASRRYTSNREYEESGLIEFAEKKINEGFDYVIMGHNHKPVVHTFKNGIYVNLGDWISKNTYAVFDGEKILLKKWTD